MDGPSFSHLVDRIGAPMALVLLFGWLIYTAIKGPGTELARLAGGAFADLCRAGVNYLGEATKRLEALPAHVSLEAASVREHVTREASATREHVSDAVGKIRDRLSDAESELGDQIQRSATGSQPASVAPMPPATEAPAKGASR